MNSTAEGVTHHQRMPGFTEDNNNARADIDDVELDENWYELRVDGRQPQRRAHHSSFAVGDRMFIYGGYDIIEGPLQSMWSFDLSSVGELANMDLDNDSALQWTEVTNKGAHKPGK